MLQGRIMRSVSGFYDIQTDTGLYRCKGRGKFRQNALTPVVGDQVLFEPSQNEGDSFITKIFPRKNFLARPPLANLDQLVFVVATRDPAPNTLILDKLIAVAEYKAIEPILVFTKTDLASVETLYAQYTASGFSCFIINNLTGAGTDLVKGLLVNKISAFTGNTGVGKSTLLNHLCPELSLQTGDVSKKLGRGRHTTRQVELFALDHGGYVADTPGFSSVDTLQYDIIYKDQLQNCFREFAPYLDSCKFTGCSHTVEKGCAVLEALQEGKIVQSRHDSYLAMYREAQTLKEWEQKKH